jgi:copper homeostasis protein
MTSLEVCANSINSAIAAQSGGAVRVELCDNLKEGGTTPSAGQITMARKLLHIKLYVLIRPRSGDFLYNDIEYETMQADIRYCIEAGCDGIVIGILNADGTIDKERNLELVRMAKQFGLGVTFHRAFDVCADLYQALEDWLRTHPNLWRQKHRYGRLYGTGAPRGKSCRAHRHYGRFWCK